MDNELELKTLTPNEILFTPFGSLLGTLGNAELEFAAACIVRYQQLKGGDEWVSMPTDDFWNTLKADELIKDWSRNPIWQPNFRGFIAEGWIEGWKYGDHEAIGTVAEKFIEAVSNPRVGPKELQPKRRLS